MTMAAAAIVGAIVDEASVGVRPAEGLGPRLLEAVLAFEARGGLTARQAAALASTWACYDGAHPHFVVALRPEVREAFFQGLSRLAEHADRLVAPRAETLVARTLPAVRAATAAAEAPHVAIVPPAPQVESGADHEFDYESDHAPEPGHDLTPLEPEHADPLGHFDSKLLLGALDAAANHHGWTGWVTYSDATRGAVSRLLGAPADAPVPASAMRLSTRWIRIPVRGTPSFPCELPEPDAIIVHLLVPRSARAPETWAARLKNALHAFLCG